jgi:hypothetical protein
VNCSATANCSTNILTPGFELKGAYSTSGLLSYFAPADSQWFSELSWRAEVDCPIEKLDIPAPGSSPAVHSMTQR